MRVLVSDVRREELDPLILPMRALEILDLTSVSGEKLPVDPIPLSDDTTKPRWPPSSAEMRFAAEVELRKLLERHQILENQ